MPSKKVFVTLAFAPLVAAACTPSFQAVYACDVHFEHCYAIDTTDQAGDLKRQCWREWLAGYTFGQARDRIEYARRRLVELAPDYVAAAADGDGGAPQAARTDLTVAPAPTNAFAPPPTTSEVHGQANAKDDHADAGGGVAPASGCTQTCEAQWETCRAACSAGGCTACDQAYRTCMPGCFKDATGGAKAPGRGRRRE